MLDLRELARELDDIRAETEIPDDYEVQPLGDDEHGNEEPAKCRATCGACGRSWDDGVSTSMTPTPSARCPFEAFHVSDALRLKALETLERDVGGDLHVAANHGVTLLTFEEAQTAVLESIEIPDVLRPHVNTAGLVDDLLADWTTIEFDGEEYHTRDV